MADYNFLDNDGLLYLVTKLKAIYNNKVDKVEGKGLSTKDFTEALETKLKGIEAGAEVNAIIQIKRNGSVLEIQSPDRSVNIEVPVKVSELTNDSGFQTAAQVTQAITDALADVSGLEFQIVAELPPTGQKGIIYLVSKDTGSTAEDIYDEYIWVNDDFEHIGSTAVDLTGYVQTSQMKPITNQEIDEMFT